MESNASELGPSDATARCEAKESSERSRKIDQLFKRHGLTELRSILVAACILACCGLCQARHAAISANWHPPALPKPQAVWLSGPWALAQALNAQRLAAPPLDQTKFILDDVALREHRKFSEYSGDLSGRWIDVAAFLGPEYPAAFAQFPEVLADLEAYQKPDGHFGANQDFAHLQRDRDMPILWGNGRMLVGLVEVYQQTGQQRALEMALRLGNYFIATDPVFDNRENMKRIGGSYADGFETCYFSCIEGLADLAGVTRNDRFTREAERIAELALSVTNFDGLHTHGRLCAVRGFAELYAVTGEPRWLAATERDWSVLAKQYLLPTGGFKEILSTTCVRDEGCAEADWLRLNLSLWRLTGKSRFLDAAERALDNHFLYQQFANGGAGHRIFYQIQQQPVAFQGISEEAWWCCGEHWGRAMADVQRYMVAGDARHLFVNLLVDGDAVVPGPGGNWKAVLRNSDKELNLALRPPRKISATVQIHRPFWAVDGYLEAPQGFTVEAHSGSWRVSGTWRGTEELSVHLPRLLRADRTGGDSGVLLSGYDVLAAPDIPANRWLSSRPPSRRPTLLWTPGAGPVDGEWFLPATLDSNPDPGRPEHWHLLQLETLRAQAGEPGHQFAWFSFQPKEVSSEQLSGLIAKLAMPPTVVSGPQQTGLSAFEK